MTLPEEQPSNGNRHPKAAYKAVQPFDIDSEEDEYRTTLSLSDVENDSVLEDEGDGMLIYKDVPTVRWAAWMPPSWYDACFPPTTPPECQLLRTENIAVPACYLLVGLLQGLSSVAINVMPLDLGATEAQQTTLSSIRSLPASFKLIFGFWSDNVSIGGYRRKPYMLLGWFVASASMLMLLLLTNLNIPARNSGCFGSSNNGEQQQELPDHTPSIPFLSVCILLFGTGFWLADVMGDSIVAEKAKLELPHQRGSIQSTCYACRFFGMMVAAPASTALYSLVGPSSVIAILALLPLTILPLVWLLGEERYKVVQSTEAQCWEIWNTVCSRSVWQPLAFVFVYNVMQVGNSAWREYLVTVLHFTSCQLNMLLIASFVLLYLGIMAYKKWFIHSSWRHVYISCTILNAVLSLLQICLIKGITFGLSPFLFTLGDDAVAEFIQGIQFLPTTIMMVHLCPAGSEGASYAAFTTVRVGVYREISHLSPLYVCKKTILTF